MRFSALIVKNMLRGRLRSSFAVLGISCSLDLGLKILEMIYGRMIAETVADRLEIPKEMLSFSN